MLFLIFANGVDSDIKSILLKFADDAKVFAKVNSDADSKQLQDDMNKLWEWAKRWQMEFNVDRCVTMHIGCGNSKFQYSMQGRKVGTVETGKDLDVHISNNLK